MKLQIGLIGLGTAWQTRHRPALRMLHDRFDVRAVFTPVSKLAETCAAEFQADPVDGYRALVSRSDIDAVMVLERSWTGWLPALAACEAGKSIYWASDFDFDPDRDKHIRAAIDESGVAFVTEFPRRFAPATLRLKELIATRLGTPKLVFCHRRIDAPVDAVQARRCSADVARQELIEAIDWCRYVVGREPDAVTAAALGGIAPAKIESTDSRSRTDQIGGGADNADYQSMSLHFDADTSSPQVTAQVSCGSYIPASWPEAAGFRPPSAMQICCERGVAFLDLPNTLVWFDDAGRHLESLETETPVGEQLLNQFHRAVTSLVRDLRGLDDAYQAAKILNAARQSYAQGERVDVS